MPDQSDDKPVNRRQFFREGLLELFKPLQRKIAPLERAAQQFARLEDAAAYGAAAAKAPEIRRAEGAVEHDSYTTPADDLINRQYWLRPPGAMSEQAYRDTCSKCRSCISACPANCIKIDEAGVLGRGVPYIDADTSPCVVCDGLYCMQQCPTGALQSLSQQFIDMGDAVWKEADCLRSHGESCSICVDRCPIGMSAIQLDNEKIRVIAEGCIGCGVCQHYCPTSPKSIVVVPASERDEQPTSYD